jgi:hypothetical protein
MAPKCVVFLGSLNIAVYLCLPSLAGLIDSSFIYITGDYSSRGLTGVSPVLNVARELGEICKKLKCFFTNKYNQQPTTKQLK